MPNDFVPLPPVGTVRNPAPTLKDVHDELNRVYNGMNQLIAQINNRFLQISDELGQLDRTDKVLFKLGLTEKAPIIELFDQEFITSESFYTAFTAIERQIDAAFQDKQAPATPAGFTAVSSPRTASDGSIIPRIVSSWNKNTEADLWFYQVSYLVGGLPTFIDKVLAAGNQSILDPAIGGTTYTVNVRAVDKRGNWSAPTGDINVTPASTGVSTIGGSNQIAIGSNNIVIDGVNSRIHVLDNQTPQRVRALIGRLGPLVTQWGVQIFDQNGALIVDLNNLGAQVVGTAQLADLAVTTAKIATASIDTTKIQTAAITNALISNLAVDTAKITDLSVTTLKIAPNAASQLSSTWGGSGITSQFNRIVISSVSLITIGGPVTANARFVWQHLGGLGDPGEINPVTLEIWRDGIGVALIDTITINDDASTFGVPAPLQGIGIDVPSAGFHTWYLVANASFLTGFTDGKIQVLESRR